MKKLTALLIVCSLLLCLCACNKKEQIAPSQSSEAEQSAAPTPSVSQSSELNTIVVPSNMGTQTYSCTVVSSDGLILRTGPSTEYDAIGVLEDGAALTELANQNGWVYVDVAGQQGWVFGQYIEYK